MKNTLHPKNLLFFRLDARVGDCVVHSFVIRELKKLFPQARLTVATFAPSDVFFKRDPAIDQLVVLPNISKGYLQPKVLWALLKMLYRSYAQGYDLIIPNPVLATWRNTLYCHLLPHTVFPTFDYTHHIVNSYKNLLKQLGAQTVDTSYALPLTEDLRSKAANFLEKSNLRDNQFVVVNPTGSTPERNLSIEQIKEILDFLSQKNQPAVLLDYKQQFKEVFKNAILCESQDILEVTALLEKAKAVITVDTGIVHIADALKKPLLALYAHDKYGTPHNRTFWASIQSKTLTLQSADTIKNIPLTSIQKPLEELLS